MKVEIYADGSGNTFDSDGGYGWRLVVDGALVAEGSGYLAKATNNVAEIVAAIEGLKFAFQYLQLPRVQLQGPHSVSLVSDSQLVLGYASGSYQCKALHLTTLYIELKKTYQAVGATVRWVRGHSGDLHNEGCDKLAKAARLGKGLTGIVCPTGLQKIKNTLENIKDNKLEKPLREPDHHSKRGVPYWFSPEWIRGTSSTATSFGKIAAVKEKNGEVNLYMKSKSGGHTYIQGSIQQEFKSWHEDRSIDYILLGMDIDELIMDDHEQ